MVLVIQGRHFGAPLLRVLVKRNLGQCESVHTNGARRAERVMRLPGALSRRRSSLLMYPMYALSLPT